MAEIRFQLPGATAADYGDLQKHIKAETSEVQFPKGAPPEGAAIVDLVLIALIGGGATVISSAIAAFSAYVVSRQSKQSEKNAPSPIVIVIRGTEGTENVQVASDSKIDRKAIDTAVKKVGTVTEVTTQKPTE